MPLLQRPIHTGPESGIQAEGLRQKPMPGKEEARQPEEVERETPTLLGGPSGRGRIEEGISGGKGRLHAEVPKDAPRLRPARQ
jgi:hypothetical protein